MEKIFDSIKDEESKRVIDFEKVIPMPEELNIENHGDPELLIILLLRRDLGFSCARAIQPRVKMARDRYERTNRAQRRRTRSWHGNT